MGKTGGGRGTNQHRVKGRGTANGGGRTEEVEVDIKPADETNPFDPLNQPYGATPVEEEDREQLLDEHQGIATLAELNALEATNIARGLLWLRTEPPSVEDLLNQWYHLDTHRHMFGDVWRWAGQVRTREMTVGIAPHQIRETWKAALDDTRWHIENRTYGPIETIMRLHHRTVHVHPFVNGNGRHAA